MVTISLCMIVRNEEASLDNCLASAKDIADEIIIVDTGSTDRTKEIARKYTDKIYDFEWIDDFSAARNFSFSKATKDYIFWLDADDVISPENAEKILQLKKENLVYDAYIFTYNYDFDTDGTPSLIEHVERLLRRASNPKWIGAIHEYIPIGNKTHVVLDNIEIDHRHVKTNSNERNLRIFKKLETEGHVFTLREKFLYGLELMRVREYKTAYDLLKEYIDADTKHKGMLAQAIAKASLCKLHLGDAVSAEQLIRNNAHRINMDAELLCILASTLCEQKRYEEAISTYATAMSCDTVIIPEKMTCKAHSTLLPYLGTAECYIKLGLKDQAKAFNDKARAIDPDDPTVKKNQNLILMML